ncbi:MAG: hemolysin family protein [Propionibacteriaceae bacterium]|nr:hemolysin family protein [Propionibacteriaceae bacterium]
MTQSQWIELSLALGCAIFAAWLTAAEAAIASISRSRADQLAGEGRPGARRIQLIAQDPAPYVNATIFVRTMLEITCVVLAAVLLFDAFADDWQQVGVTVAIMVVVSFLLWGVGPRTIGRQRAEAVVRFVGPLVSLLTTLFGPVAQLMILIGNALTPGKGFTDGPFSTEAELRELVDMAEASELIEAGERKMIHSVFELGDTIVKEVMVPRPDVVFIGQDATLRQCQSLALRSGFSRIPVIGDGLDDVRGVINLKDVSRRVYDRPDVQKTETVASLMRPASFCPDSKPIDELLHEMQRSRSHLVIVIDEFGGTAGLATIEDILEEIVGEITDEYDPEPIEITELDGGQYRVSARLPVDEMGELFGLDVDDEDVETVGGLMAKQLNLVPIPGSRAVWEGIEMVADKAVGRRHQIGTVLVRRLTPEELEAEEVIDD